MTGRDGNRSRAASGHGVGLCQGADIGAIYFFQVIAARRAEFYSDLGGAGMGKLFGVQSRFQAVTFAGFQDLFGLGYVERAALAEDVAIFGQLFGGDLRNRVSMRSEM